MAAQENDESRTEEQAPTADRPRKPRQQLAKGMEHMRQYVTVNGPSNEGTVTTEEDAYGVPAEFAPIRKPVSNSNENPEKRSDPFQFGTRYLEEGDDIFAHNAWDHVEVDSQYNDFISQQTLFQRSNQVTPFDKQRFNTSPEKWWDKFYSQNQANFFKDRKWLAQEFPILSAVTAASHGPVTVLEVGAGAGNTAFPLLAMNQNPGLNLHACDYSKKAIEIIRSQPAYTADAQTTLKAHVWDAAGETLPEGLTPGSVDVILMIFIFSALAPEQWTQCVQNLFTLLKPGGEVLFRDYGRGDLAQVRFKKGRYLEENFYVRGDGTRVYFFEVQELREIWSEGGTVAVKEKEGEDGGEKAEEEENEGDVGEKTKKEERKLGKFEVVNLAVDRRMLVNRQRKIKMYRCWMQGHFRKPDGHMSQAPA
jgi:tRNAThr (cytosine32-N3)-methyltransferase